MKIVTLCISYVIFTLNLCASWRAVPANQAMYAARSSDLAVVEDEKLPRDSLDQIYKFGYCTIDVIQRSYLRKSVNVTLPTYQETQLTYIYLLEKKHTQRYFQCVVMKTFVPEKFLFLKSNLHLYYCQGIAFVLMFNTINRYEIHEFYLGAKLNMPMNFMFEFYHPEYVQDFRWMHKKV